MNFEYACTRLYCHIIFAKMMKENENGEVVSLNWSTVSTIIFLNAFHEFQVRAHITVSETAYKSLW